MSDKKIRVELTEAEAREVLAHLREEDEACSRVDSVAEKISAALPPEYPEGQMAWVTDFCKKPGRTLSIRRGGVWASQVRESDGKVERWLNDHEVTKVEPLRVLADDEIAVKRPHFIPDALRGAIERLEDCSGFVSVPNWLHDVADALDAKAKS